MSFSKDIERWAAKTEQTMDKAVRGIMLQLTRGIVLSTPVATGRARGNWQASINMPASGTLDKLSPSGGEVITEAAGSISAAVGERYFLVNNLPYIQRLEYGHSSQAPAGMVRVNLERIKTNIQEQLRS